MLRFLFAAVIHHGTFFMRGAFFHRAGMVLTFPFMLLVFSMVQFMFVPVNAHFAFLRPVCIVFTFEFFALGTDMGCGVHCCLAVLLCICEAGDECCNEGEKGLFHGIIICDFCIDNSQQ